MITIKKINMKNQMGIIALKVKLMIMKKMFLNKKFNKKKKIEFFITLNVPLDYYNLL